MRRINATLIVCLLSSTAIAAPRRNYDDAPLRAVTFIDRNEGWAVGDDGVVWHTIDSGENWERQKTGVHGSLRAVQFLNPYTGWAVGREELPGGGSAGIILVTADGGLKWTRLALNTLPGLHALKFFDGKNGIVAGDSNDRYSSGVFATADGGQTWRIVPGPRQPGWLCADFSDAKTGVLGGTWSSLAMVRESVIGTSDTETFGGRAIMGVRMLRDMALAVGQGGLILRSDDSGGKWKNAAPKTLTRDALMNCDFHGVCVLGEHAWVVGRPGSIVLHSGDYGHTWEVLKTGQGLTLHAVHFMDSQNGCAVGELGMILATADGGKTWTCARHEHHAERAAMLFAHAGPTTLPLDAIAQFGGDDGYLCAALRITAADPAAASLKHAADAQKWAQAVRDAGGCGGDCLWHFPVASYQSTLDAKDLVAALDPLHGGAAGDMMIRQLVLAIRAWQPEVIICDDTHFGGECLCHDAMCEAYKRAADRNAFAEQITELGLRPWAAKKLTSLSDGRRWKVEQPAATTDPLVLSGESAYDIAHYAAEAFVESVNVPKERHYVHIECQSPELAGGRLLNGIELAHDGTARRKQVAVTQAELEQIDETAKLMRVRRNIEALAKPDWRALGGGPEAMIGQMGTMLKGLPAEHGARACYSVASAYAADGQWMMAREVFELMASRYPTHPLSAEAYRWLAQHASSSEARRRHELGQFVASTKFELKQASQTEPPNVTRNPIQSPEARNWYNAAPELEPKMAAFGSLYLHDPAFQMSLQSARRSLGDAEAAQKWIKRFVGENVANGRTADPWRECAAAELWLTERSTHNSRPSGLCRMTPKRPNLDGKLDDECWQDLKPLALKSAAGNFDTAYSAKAMFAYDREFLYIAIECKHPEGKQIAKVEKRKRDEDLRNYDRVGIMLDLDRDFQTYYHLQIDQRGCLCDDCWGDKSWNPKWFVAVDSTATGWTAEVAIPLTELTGEAITAGRVWACNVVRVVPGKGIQSWSTPADVDPRPEGMGMLMFTEKHEK
jgi:photosystem II stability/assembly factor-like uncharacterized protein